MDMIRSMNTSPSNPFTGLKGALAGLMSGGWMGLLLGLLFRHRIAPMLAALEGLFAQWKAGTLALPAAPVRPTTRTPVARKQAAAPAAPRAHCRGSVSRRRHVTQPVAARVQPPSWPALAAPRLPMPSLRASPPSRRHGRCTKNAASKARTRTLKLLRYQNK